jgi:hypothetical protein
MAGMDVFGSIGRWASSAWNGLTSLTGDVSSFAQAIWSFVSSVYGGLSWVVKVIISPGYYIVYGEFQAFFRVMQALRDAVDRVAWWVWTYMITPVRADLLLRIWLLTQSTMIRFQALTNLVLILHLVEERHTDTMVAAERQQRIADIASARAYSRALTTQLHQAIEAEAVAGYKAGLGVRTTLLQQLAQDLNVRGILDTVSTSLLIKAIDALVTVEDPVLAAAANRIIGVIIKKSGIGADLGDLIDRLINPGAGGHTPKDLTGVIADITHRLGVIEDWISRFELDGGPELHDAGRQMKTMNSLVVDAALLAFFGQAVAAPEQWAREVSDTLGAVANDTFSGIMRLINRV